MGLHDATGLGAVLTGGDGMYFAMCPKVTNLDHSTGCGPRRQVSVEEVKKINEWRGQNGGEGLLVESKKEKYSKPTRLGKPGKKKVKTNWRKEIFNPEAYESWSE